MSLKKIIIPIFLSFLVINSSYAADNEFPGRKKYPDIAVMEKAELSRRFNDVVIVDARSAYEFQTLRIKSAVNIPVAAKTFETQVQQLRNTHNKDIVFYCNGRTCMKSYIAAKKAKLAGVKHVYAYDAGIFEWVKTYPKLGELMGVSPVNLKRLIAKDSFKKRLLEPDVFSEKMVSLGPNSIVLDVRDKYQRAGVGFYPGKERWVSLDRVDQLEKFIEKAKKGKKTLLIYDEVGKQVRWVQYSLEKAGLQDYYFMEKGASEYFRQMRHEDKTKKL